MKRRRAIQGIVLFTLGTGYLFSCKDKFQAIKDLGLKHFNPLREELELIDILSSMIVPLHKIPALENHTSLPFIFKMLDDTYPPGDRELFKEVYQSFDATIGEFRGQLFSSMEENQQFDLVASLDQEENDYSASLNTFFNILKDLNIRYLRTSEFYQRKVNYYEMEPGRFHGDVLISDLKNRNQL